MIDTEYKPLVSIVIPVYNGAKYLHDAIDSALGQSYKSVEIIVINDGSTDGDETEKVALSYGDRIRYYKKENGGVATALNLGIKKMRGEYFSWLSHDDIYLPDKIKKELQCIKNGDVVYSEFVRVDSEGRKLPLNRQEPKSTYQDNIYYQLIGGYLLNGCAMLIRRDVFDRVGYFDPALRSTQDYDYWYRCANENIKFCALNDIVLLSRVHDEQGSAMDKNHFHEVVQLYIKMVQGLINNKAFGKMSCENITNLTNSLFRRGFWRAGVLLASSGFCLLPKVSIGIFLFNKAQALAVRLFFMVARK